jgi:hypothetical protein
MSKNRFEKSLTVPEKIEWKVSKNAGVLTKHITYQYLFELVCDGFIEKVYLYEGSFYFLVNKLRKSTNNHLLNNST